MRSILSAAACFSVCLFLSANNTYAHGPAGGGHGGGGHDGGHPNVAVHSVNGNGFLPGGSSTSATGGPSANRSGNNNRPNSSSLRPNSSTSTTSTSGSSSATNTSSATTNTSSGGSAPLAGEIARIHHLEQELRRLKMEEALQLLQRAKQSGNSQLLAKAEQMLQQKQQNRPQQGGNANATAPAGQSTVHPTPVLGGQSGSREHLSHTSSGGHSAGHAHR